MPLQISFVFRIFPQQLFCILFGSPWGYGSMVPQWGHKILGEIYLSVYQPTHPSGQGVSEQPFEVFSYTSYGTLPFTPGARAA